MKADLIREALDLVHSEVMDKCDLRAMSALKLMEVELIKMQVELYEAIHGEIELDGSYAQAVKRFGMD